MVDWLNPEHVQRFGGQWRYNGVPVSDAELLHIPAVVLPGERLGLSPIGACSATMTTGLETQRFMKDWYRNKAVPGMVFKNTERMLEPDVADTVKERLRGTLRAGDPFVTGKDWQLDVVKLSADDAGFVASAKLNATQIANIFGIPPQMIGGEAGNSLTYSTVELNQLQFVTNTLRPWIVRLEAAFSSLLPRPQYVKFNVDAMIRADTKTRYEVHQIARNIGLNNIDELRALEDMDPLPNGQGQDYAPSASAPSSPAPIEETP
jgi:HK97 family phage portal protein